MLKVENIDVHYGNIHAIKGISFDVKKGEVVTLIGANGAGKTTILKTVSKLMDPSAGTITFDGKPLSKLAPHEMVYAGMAHVPEGRRVFSKMSVEENLQMGAFIRKDKENIKKDLEMVFKYFPRLKERMSQAAGTLSGGEQQMLAIGRALMSRPKLLLMDEPSMGLAPLLVQEIFNIVETIKETGTTILLVEQNANQALQVADRAYVLETGKIIQSGSAKELLADDSIRKAYLGG